MEFLLSKTQASGLRRNSIRTLIIVGIAAVFFLLYINEPPTSFPIGKIITVQSGQSLNEVEAELKADHIIRSSTFFKILAILFVSDQKLVAGDYYFSQPISDYSIMRRLTAGDFDLAPVRVTIPEGSTMKQISDILAPKFKHFSSTDFMKHAPADEGYLFPDTYFFASDITADGVIDAMQKNFSDKIKALAPAIVTFGRAEKDVITMASILEKEARSPDDLAIVSGILWKRLDKGMPLQVDSTLGYVIGKTSAELTSADLKMDSPYNTYANKGLPPTPISNPGLETIQAAVTPTSTPYFYYLSDQNGVIHYAATFAQHIKNVQKYIP